MAIFFDIDNTLLDDKFAVRQACSAIQKQFGSKINTSIDDFLVAWDAALEEYFDDLYLSGKISFEDQRIKRVNKVFGIKDPKIADEIFQVYLKEYENNWTLFSDSKPCLEKLKNKTLGIISNGDFDQQIQKLQNLNIKHYFKTITISGKTGYSKPDPQIFKIACNSINSKPENCIYIGDKLKHDAQACEKIGMRGIWLNRKKEEDETSDIKVIYNLDNLPDLL